MKQTLQCCARVTQVTCNLFLPSSLWGDCREGSHQQGVNQIGSVYLLHGVKEMAFRMVWGENVLSLLTEFPTTRKKKSHLHANLLSVLRLWESDWCLLAPLLYNNKTTSSLFMSSFTSIINKLHSLCIMFFRCILQEFVASTIKILRQIFPTIYFVVLTNV